MTKDSGDEQKQDGAAYSPSQKKGITNLDPRAHVSFGQHQDTQLWNN